MGEAEDKAFIAGVRDIVIYIAYLVLFSIVAFSTSQDAFPLTSKMTTFVLGDGPGSWEDVVSVENAIEFIQDHVFGEVLFFDPEGDDSERPGYVLEVNKIIGAIRLSQKRVVPTPSGDDDCDIPSIFSDEITHCYLDLDDGEADERPYGGKVNCKPPGDPALLADEMTPPCDDSFTSKIDLAGWDSGYLADPEYEVIFPSNLTLSEATAQYEEVRGRGFFDLATREIRIVFTVYNPAIDLFCTVDLMLMPTPTGGVEVEHRIRTFYMMRHLLILSTTMRSKFPAQAKHMGLLVAEALLYGVAFLLWMQTVTAFRCKKLFHFWYMLDLTNYSFIMAVFSLRVTIVSMYNSQVFDPEPNQYVAFVELSNAIFTVANFLSLSSVFSWIKLLRFLKLSTRLSQLTSTITAASPDLVGFMVIFAIVFIGFAQAYYLAFGMDVEDFSGMTEATISLFLVILGEFDFAALREANDAIGPFLFFSFVVIVFFILVNMFIAILGEAHGQVLEREEGYDDGDAFINGIRGGWLVKLEQIRKNKKGGGDVVELASKVMADQESLEGGEELKASTKEKRRDALQKAEGVTLLQALQQGKTAPPKGDGGGGGGGGDGGIAVGPSSALAEELTEQLARMEHEHDQLCAYLHKNHAILTEKVGILTEATFAISNMVGGVGGGVLPPEEGASSAATGPASLQALSKAPRSTGKQSREAAEKALNAAIMGTQVASKRG